MFSKPKYFAARAICILLFLCSLQVQADSSKKLATIQVGAIYGLTGPMAAMSEQYQKGAILAQKYLIDQRIIELDLLFEDTQWQTHSALSAYRKLRSTKSIEVMHLLGSSPVLAIKPLSEKEQVLLFAAAAHPDILKNSNYIIQHANQADLDAKILAAAVTKKQPKRVAIVSIMNEWATSYKDFLIEELTASSEIAIQSEEHLSTETDFKGILSRTLAQKPDILVINSFGLAAAELIIQARKLGFSGPIFANTGLSLSSDAMKLLHQSEQKNLYYQTYEQGPKKFIDFYQKHFKHTADPLAYLAFIDFELIGKIAAEVGPDASKIITAIKKLEVFESEYGSIKIQKDGAMPISTIVKAW